MCVLSKLKDETAGIWCEKEVSFFRKVYSDHEVIYCEWMDILADVNVLVNVEWPLDRWAVRYFPHLHWVDSSPVIVLSSNFFRDRLGCSWLLQVLCSGLFAEMFLLWLLSARCWHLPGTQGCSREGCEPGRAGMISEIVDSLSTEIN